MGDSRSVVLAAAVIGALATVAAAVIAIAPNLGILGPGTGPGPAPTPGPTVVQPGGPPPAPDSPATTPEIFLSDTSAPSGGSLNVSGEGFAPGENVLIRVHTFEVARTQASGTGRFANVAITVPDELGQFAPAKFDVVADGQQSIRSARRQLTVSG